MWQLSEKLLQFIWQFRRYNMLGLKTEDGHDLLIIHPGKVNVHQGPDFSEAKIKIDNTTWIGNIEIHIKSGQWHTHAHTKDVHYNNIILHVVWENDIPIYDNQGNKIPTLVLQPLVSKIMMEHYQNLMEQKNNIPCGECLPALSDLSWLAWKERMAAERLTAKASVCIDYFKQAHQHWEDTCWWYIARSFGMKTNAVAFEQMARTLPVKLLHKYKNQIHQLEALLLGQCRLLEGNFTDNYPKMLQKEYQFLAAKHGLEPIAKPPLFLRMRPANFPTIRLAQLAALIQQSVHLFSKIKDAENPLVIEKLLNVSANDYWHYHYKFDEATDYKEKATGRQLLEHIIINAAAPLLYAYGLYLSDDHYKQKAMQWLMQTKPEINTITKQWTSKNVTNNNALESQALIHLLHNYCDEKKCLSCAVGMKLLQ